MRMADPHAHAYIQETTVLEVNHCNNFEEQKFIKNNLSLTLSVFQFNFKRPKITNMIIENIYMNTKIFISQYISTKEDILFTLIQVL